jgi:Flp pilus assembly pilin Flp
LPAHSDDESYDLSVFGVDGLNLKTTFRRVLMTKILTWLRSEQGASMVEYSLLVVLIAIIALVALRFAGQETSTMFSEISSDLLGAKS